MADQARAANDWTDDEPKAVMDVLYGYLTRELPNLWPPTGIARDILHALREMPVADRMEAMGMVDRRASFDGQTFSRCWTEDYS